MAATKLYLNVAASDISRALVRSLTDMTPVGFPQLVVGDGRSYELYFVDGLGGYAPFSGDGSYIPYIAIGLCGYPTGGTATWTFGANTTAALPYNVSPAALQTALQALASVGSGNLLVGGVAGKYYTFTFAGTLANAPQAEISANFSLLTPASTIDVTTVVPGTVSPPVSAVQLAALALNPITFADDWTPITNGWTGALSARTVEILEAFAAAGGTLTEVFQVTVANADGVRTTYAKVDATIQCTIISPESFAGSDKPLLATQAALNAAVLGLGNFTREALTSAADGNTNVTRPSGASRHHLARISFSGSGVDRTVSILAGTTPNPGDFVWIALLPTEAYAYRYRIYNATTGGTLLADVQATDAQIPYLLAFSWSGSAWELDSDPSIFLTKAENLVGLTDTVTAKANLRALFARIQDPSADFAVVEDDEGTLFRVDASGGPVLVTLPAANSVDAGFLIAVQKADAGPQIVTTTPATKTLASPGATAILQSDGNDWRVVMAYDPNTITPTLAQVVENREDLTTLAAIRAEATIAGAVATNAAWFVAAGEGGIWVLEDSAAADNGINVLRPDDFDETLNPRTWNLKLRGAPALLAEGDTLYFNGTDLVRLAIGTPGQLLTVNDDEDDPAPEWADAPPSAPGYAAVTVTSPDDVQMVNPATPIHVAIVALVGTAGANELRIVAPPDPGGPPGPGGYYAGWLCKIRVAIPATAGITLAVLDNNSVAELVAFDSDDGGGTAQNAAIELYWDGSNWKMLSLVFPTP